MGRPNRYQHARSMSQWQMFFAVVCFLLFGLLTLYIGLMLVLVGGGNARSVLSGSLSMASCVIGLMTLVYLVLGLLFVRGATAAKRFSNIPDPTTLVAMLESQLWLWRTVGGLTLVGMAMWLVGMLLTVFFMV